MKRILLCDDEVKLSRVLQTALTSAGYAVECVTTGRAALARCAEQPFDLVLTDLRLPDVDGLAVTQTLRADPAGPEVIVMTAYATAETAVQAMRLGAYDYLIKPFSIDELRIRVARLCARRALQEENGQLQERLSTLQRTESLVGTSARMREVFELLSQVASTDATVIFLGESGTGKTVLARSLHQQSRRRRGPFCELHCAALPETLLESELFGHERGAFTGASAEHVGHVQQAHRGSLFLDEIGELPATIQVKLLRFLQDRQFCRVGSTQVRTVDVRFIAASNRDLLQAVRERVLREDFFYRINVFPIVVPSLRERSEDIPALCHSFLLRRHPGARVTPEALELLQNYPWPGNIRELENVLERAVIVAGSASGEDSPVSIELRHLPVYLRDSATVLPTATLLRPGFSIDQLEHSLIHEAIARASGNKTEAAKMLGITRRRLYSRLKSLAGEAGGGAAEDLPPEDRLERPL